MKRVFSFLLAVAIILSPAAALAKSRIQVNIPSRALMLFDDDVFVKKYPIAVGRPSYDSPIGHYSILTKQVNPTWYPKGKKPVKPGPANPLGTRWIGFHKDYGVHGNNKPESIGTFASKGCIRMFNYDVEELFDRIAIGDSVDIYYNTLFTYDNPNKVKSALVVYPDLYNKRANSLPRIKEQLDKMGLLQIISPNKLEKLYASINKKTTVFAKGWTLFINGDFISADTKIKSLQSQTGNLYGPTKAPLKTVTAEDVLVNLNDINSILGLDLRVNIGILEYDGKPIYFEMYNGVVYASVLDSVRAIEGYFEIDQTQEKINWIITYGKLDDKFFRISIKTTGHEVYVSVKDIATALGKKVSWDDAKSVVLVGSKEIKPKIIGDRAYITTKQIKEYFGLDSDYSSYQNSLYISR